MASLSSAGRRAMVWLGPLLSVSCAWGAGVDRASLERSARAHHDAIAAAAPDGGACDGLVAVVEDRSPAGCRYRPASSLAESGAVAARCAALLEAPGDEALAAVTGLYGAWAATPVPLSTCATLVGAYGSPEQRRQLPPDAVAVHGARWEAWLALGESPADDGSLGGWAEVEAACGELLAPGCLTALQEDGPEATRVAIDGVLDALREARAGR